MPILKCVISQGCFFRQVISNNFDAIPIIKPNIPSHLHKMVTNLQMEDICTPKVAMVMAKNNGIWQMDVTTLTSPHSHSTQRLKIFLSLVLWEHSFHLKLRG
jgi:hypothetical protein